MMNKTSPYMLTHVLRWLWENEPKALGNMMANMDGEFSSTARKTPKEILAMYTDDIYEEGKK